MGNLRCVRQDQEERNIHKISIRPLKESGSVPHKIFIDEVEMLGITNICVCWETPKLPIVKLGNGAVVVRGALMDGSVSQMLRRYPDVLHKLLEITQEGEKIAK